MWEWMTSPVETWADLGLAAALAAPFGLGIPLLVWWLVLRFQRLQALRWPSTGSEQALQRLLTRLDGEFGPRHRQVALRSAREVLGAMGFTPRNPPPALTTELALRTAYIVLSKYSTVTTG